MVALYLRNWPLIQPRSSFSQSSPLRQTQHNIMPAFTFFKLLPLELRLKIWTYAQPDSRTIRVRNSEEEGFLDFYNACCYKIVAGCHCLDRQYPLLFACKESRYEYLRSYSRVPTARELGKASQQSGTYFNPKKDIILLDNHDGGYFDIWSTVHPVYLPDTPEKMKYHSRFANTIRVAALPFPQQQVLSGVASWRLDAYIALIASNFPCLEEIICSNEEEVVTLQLDETQNSSSDIWW